MDSVRDPLKLTVCILGLGLVLFTDAASDRVRDSAAVMESDSNIKR